MLKITLVVVLAWTTYGTTVTVSPPGGITLCNSSIGCSTSTGTTSSTQAIAPVLSHRKIAIPMTDLEACRKARKQFTDIPDVVAATCDEE